MYTLNTSSMIGSRRSRHRIKTKTMMFEEKQNIHAKVQLPIIYLVLVNSSYIVLARCKLPSPRPHNLYQ